MSVHLDYTFVSMRERLKRKILVTDKVHSILLDGLEQMGHEVTYTPKMSYADVCDEVSQYDAIIINSKVICDQAFLLDNQHLNFIGRLGSGLDIIDLRYAEELGIAIISSPEGNANAVGEHCLGMLLMLLHQLNSAHATVQKGEWIREAHRGEALRGKTIGIVGFGHTGPAFAEKLNGMGVDILVYDKYKKDIAQEGLEQVNFQELKERADIVSIHLPLTDETKDMVDDSFFGSLRSGAIIINTSRGLILKSEDLLNHLKTGHMGGACLDVLENEKPDTWADREKKIYLDLLNHEKVVATPHVAGWTHQSLRLIAEVLLEKIGEYYKECKIT